MDFEPYCNVDTCSLVSVHPKASHMVKLKDQSQHDLSRGDVSILIC